jgi:hypothetical protein
LPQRSEQNRIPAQPRAHDKKQSIDRAQRRQAGQPRQFPAAAQEMTGKNPAGKADQFNNHGLRTNLPPQTSQIFIALIQII